MTDRKPLFEKAVELVEAGEVDALRDLFQRMPDLAQARDDGEASLLIRLIDWPGHRPRAAESARVLLESGVDVEARRNETNGTALAGALCTEEIDVVSVLLEFGADIHAPLGWMPGTNLDLADRICQNLDRQGDEAIIKLSRLFSDAAGRTIPSRVPLGRTTPLVFVEDADKGIDFYKEKLGFHLDWSYDYADGKYACVSRGSAEFHVTVCSCDGQRHTGKLWVRVACGPVDPLFDEFSSKGVTILEEPKNRPYGMREFEIEDLDGNRLTFAGPIPPE